MSLNLKPLELTGTLILRASYRLLFFICCVSAGVPVEAQQLAISGQVVNSQNNEPVEFAHVRVGDVVTYTNAGGGFILNVAENPQRKLEVFQIGFDPYRAQVQAGEPFQIMLDPASTENAVPDTATGEEIMREVFLRFPTNYAYDDQLMTSYYKEKLTGNGELFYFSDEVLDMYLPLSATNAPPFVRPVKSRVSYVKPYPHKGVALSGGGPTEMVQSSIRVNNSFLAPKNQWDYTYTLVGTDVHRDENVFVIEFEPANGKGYLKGRIYVDAVFYAILQLEYAYIKDEGKKWTEEFQHIDYAYYLFRSTYEDRWEAGGRNFVFSSVLINTSIKTDQAENMDWQGFVAGRKYAPEEVSKGPFTSDFWAGNNYLMLTEEEENAVGR